jgi:isocitrate/isopropylmalate dehydrogenase
MLDYLDEGGLAGHIRTALEKTLREGRVLTPDLGGKAGTEDFASAVIDHLARDVAAV